jgi:hypothetical protein
MRIASWITFFKAGTSWAIISSILDSANFSYSSVGIISDGSSTRSLIILLAKQYPIHKHRILVVEDSVFKKYIIEANTKISDMRVPSFTKLTSSGKTTASTTQAKAHIANKTAVESKDTRLGNS